jgi:hypothetical protein
MKLIKDLLEEVEPTNQELLIAPLLPQSRRSDDNEEQAE